MARARSVDSHRPVGGAGVVAARQLALSARVTKYPTRVAMNSTPREPNSTYTPSLRDDIRKDRSRGGRLGLGHCG